MPSPPSLTSTTYADSLNTVRRLGSADSTERTADQTEAARFWRQGSGTSRPTGTWFKVVQAYVEAQGLDALEAARLYAKMGLAIADSTRLVWGEKFDNAAWRPQAAIRRADEDGNAATVAVLDWSPLNGGQGGGPEYLSGQAVFSGAAAQVLADAHGSDTYMFDLMLDTLDISRSFTSFSQAAKEASDSRVWIGTHFPFTLDTSLAIGTQLGAAIAASALPARVAAPVPLPPSLALLLGGLGIVIGFSARARRS